MIEELNERLRDAVRRREEAERARRLLLGARRNRDAMREQVEELRARHTKEEDDVRKLEGFSLTGLFVSLLGDRKLKLKEEQREALEAKLAYDEKHEALEALEEEIREHESRLADLEGWEADYEAALEDKAHYLASSGDARGRRLVGISEETGSIEAETKEIEEALGAGRSALRAVESVLASLKSAANWGTWDMLGGGFMATAMKHGKIDDARAAAHRAQRLLRRFRRELEDVRDAPRVAAEVRVEEFSMFADYFFDGLIFDWRTQGKIDRAKSAVEKSRRKVAVALRRLEARSGELTDRRRELDEERRALLEGPAS
jgi:hypothetical protein